MQRSFSLLPLVFALGAVRGQAEEQPAGPVRQLEERVERVARQASGSVACILVSRSDAYQKAKYWGEPGPGPGHPGQLGRFDAAAARKRIPADAPNRARLLRQVSNHDLSDPDIVPESYGSGFVLDGSGLVLTNAHVVRNATRVYVRLPGKRGSWADIHASDPRSDLAVLKLLDAPAGLEALPLGEGGKVGTGQFVISIANSFAPGFRRSDAPTVGWGLVSNLRRRIPPAPGKQLGEMDLSRVTLHHYGTLIQTSAQTTPGCSGGALLDLDGKVIGLSTALAGIRGEAPGGFAIPFDTNIKGIIEVLRKGEEVEYGFLGVVLRHGLEEDGPAGSVRLYRSRPARPPPAGLVPGDVVESINGHRVRRNNDLFLYLGTTLAGNTASVEVSRGGVPRTYKIKLAKFYVPGAVVASKRPPARFGLRVDYTSILAATPSSAWSRAPAEGVIVREVLYDTPADRARLQPDKIITQVNGKAVRSPAEYYKEIAGAGRRVELTFLTSEGRPERLTLEEK